VVWTGDHLRALVLVRLRATRGCRRKCVALPEGGDDTCCSASSPLPRRASPATAGCEALGTTDPHPKRVAIGARAEIATASTKAVGGQGRVVRPTQVNRRERRKQRRAEGADRLGPKGKWPGPDAADSSGADGVPPASRRGLTHEDSCDATWSARRPPARVGPPRGEPMGRRVEDGGGSEGRPVTGRIGVGTSPRAKASPLPPGVGGWEPTANRLGGQSRSVAGGNARGAAPADLRSPALSKYRPG
jgi:hypothetical protein